MILYRIVIRLPIIAGIYFAVVKLLFGNDPFRLMDHVLNGMSAVGVPTMTAIMGIMVYAAVGLLLTIMDLVRA
jgi:hypothetical protein